MISADGAAPSSLCPFFQGIALMRKYLILKRFHQPQFGCWRLTGDEDLGSRRAN
jgi:hypothetical protein